MYHLPAFLLFSAVPGIFLSANGSHRAEEPPPHRRHAGGRRCATCDGADCPQRDELRCEYYKEVGHVFDEVGSGEAAANPAVRAVVDAKLSELIERESTGERECVPYVSQHTSCNKDNACVGCATCSCDATGRWRCVDTQRCRGYAPLDIDHRVLVQVMENLNDSQDDTRPKTKRSVGGVAQPKTSDGEELTSLEISSIINGSNGTGLAGGTRAHTNALDNLFGVTGSVEAANSTADKMDSLNDSDLEFDDLFPAYNMTDGNHTKLHLPMLKQHTEDILEPDYMDTPDVNATQNARGNVDKILENQAHFLKQALLNTRRGEARKMIFYANFNKDISDLSNVDSNVKGFLVPSAGGDVNDVYEGQSVRVVKRQAAAANGGVGPKPALNSSRGAIRYLKEDVFDQLTSIINDKHREIVELERIRNNLREYLKLYVNNGTYLNVNEYALENITKTYFNIYNMELPPPNEDYARRNTTAPFVDYFTKLQNDIYEVISDIANIQKNSTSKDLSEDLNVLVRSVRHYVHRRGRVHIEDGVRKINENNRYNYRKFTEPNRNGVAGRSAAAAIRDVLAVVDQDMPRSNGLAPLSAAARKVVRRIIDSYRETFAERKSFNSRYNVVEELKDVGIKWYKTTRRVASSRLPDRAVALKLLHLELSRDMCKVRDVSAFVGFAQSRRFILADVDMIDHYATRIGEDLNIISRKIDEVVKVQNDVILRTSHRTTVTPAKSVARRNSFLQQVKRLLKRSETDIRNVFGHKDGGKFYGDHKRADGTKWQDVLYGNVHRKKRSAPEFNKGARRIKNIIPNYLRDKFGKARKSTMAKSRL